MNDTDQVPGAEEAPRLPSNFRLKPSRNQKQRSKLKQLPDDAASAEVPPAPAEPEPPTAAPPPPAPLHKRRLKRSGHMHDDLKAPLPEEPAAPEEQY